MVPTLRREGRSYGRSSPTVSCSDDDDQPVRRRLRSMPTPEELTKLLDIPFGRLQNQLQKGIKCGEARLGHGRENVQDMGTARR